MSLPPEIIAPVFVSDPDEKSICIPIPIFVNEGAQNVDRSANQEGIIHHKVTLYLQITETEERREFLVVNCGQENLILGLSWL